jgi:hypothetical protein
VGRSFANGHYIENLSYVPIHAGEEGQEEAVVIGEFVVLSISPLGLRQRMEDAARVVVRW